MELKTAINTILVLTFMYEAYDEVIRRQPEAGLGKNNRTERQEVDDLRRKRLVSFSKRLFRIIIIIHIALAIKYSLVGLLYWETFADYRIYDCYIFGRASFNSKLYLPNIILMLLIIAYSLTYRFVIISRAAPSFNYELLTFHQLKSEEVLWNEIQMRAGSHIRRKNSGAQAESTRAADIIDRYSISEGMGIDNRQDWTYGQLKFHFINPFLNQSDRPGSMLLRPNRTLDARNESIKGIVIFAIGGPIIFICIGLSFLSVFCLGKTFTTRGFQLNYNLCVDYIKNLDRNHSSDFSYIYDIDCTFRAGQKEESSLVFNLYHVIRSSADLFDDIFIWIDCLVASVLHSHLMILQVLDLIVYANLLEQNLITSIDIMRKQSNSTLTVSTRLDSVCNDVTTAQNEPNNDRCQSLRESTDYSATTLQAYLLDYLRLVRSYQGYSSFQVAAVLSIWIIFNGCISFWMALNKNVEISEFRWAQPCLAIAAAYLLSVSAYFEMRSRRLYQYISVAMALDMDIYASKMRWLNLTKFFTANPMYCFAFFGRTELSWLFCMKTLVWVITVSIFISNFYTLYSK